MLLTNNVKVHSLVIPIDELSLKSHKIVEVKCDNCGEIKKIKYYSYNKSTNNNSTKYYCNNKECINKKRKFVIQEKYGVDNVSNLESVKVKKIETTLKNFGVEYPTQSDEVKDKIKVSINKKYGEDYYTQTDNFKKKSKITNLKKYGKEYAIQSEEIKDKIKGICVEKYGVNSYMETEKFKEQSKKTFIKKYGVDHPSKSECIQDKIKKTNIKRYGVDRATKNENIKKKIKETFINNYGVDNPNKLEVFRDKIKKTNLEKYNSIFYSQSDEYKNKIKIKKLSILSNKYDLNIVDIVDSDIISYCDKCNSNFIANYQLLYNRFLYEKSLCTNCFPVDSNISESEIEVQKFIKENYKNEIIYNNRKIISPYELDIYLPDLNLAFEFNGLYWHNELNKDKNYHLNKTELCENKGINLIHVWEDDWEFKKDIVKSIILNKLGLIEDRIFARKCKIKDINSKLYKNFLNDNHLQGYVTSSIKVGLFYKNELVSVMGFGKKRKIMNSKNDNSYEMYRFCNKLNTNIIGGFSKLLKFFLRTYDYSELISYVDRSYFNGKGYKNVGFKLISKTKPNYHYIVGRKRKYRFGYRKDKLVKDGFDPNKSEREIMLERKIYRIYNSGNLKFTYK